MRNLVFFLVLLFPFKTYAQKVFLNPSDQYENQVAGGGNEAQYAKINADNTAAILKAAGFQVVVDQDFYNAPKNANSWGADIFVSIHSNAGGGHGTETLYVSSGGKVLASHVQAGLLSYLPYQDRGLKLRTDLYVLNATKMYAALAEVVFHDCAKQSGYQGHPPSESDFLKSAEGQQKIANGLASGICSYFGHTCGGGVVPTLEKGFFKGVVYKAPNMNDRIPHAKVVLNTGQSVIASNTGYFEFELDPGTYTATAYAEGFEPNSSTRTVEAGKEIWGSIGLTKISEGPDEGPIEPSPEDASKDAHGLYEEVIVEEERLEETSSVIERDNISVRDGHFTQTEDPKEEPQDLAVANEEGRSSKGSGCTMHPTSPDPRAYLIALLLAWFIAKQRQR